jgi:hypothetical protein
MLPVSTRLLGVDLVRTVSFLCIAIYHAYATFIYVPYEPSAWLGTAMPLIHALPRALPFSGFTIVAIYAFLAGLRARPVSLRRPLLVVLPGLALLFLAYSDIAARELFWEWDIYHYLLVALASLLLLSGSTRLTYAFGALGAILLLFPLWNWIPAEGLPLALAHALVGVCDAEGRGGWFLLPWIGLPWAFLAMGRLLRARPPLGMAELAAWLPFLLAGVVTWGAYWGVDIGPGFYCFIFRQPPLVFWGHFLWITFALRLAADPRVQEWLERRTTALWLGGLAINRRFGLAYLTHLLLLWAGESWLRQGLGPRPSFYLYVLLLLPATELGTRAIERAYAAWRRPS